MTGQSQKSLADGDQELMPYGQRGARLKVMTAHHPDPFAHAEHTADRWLDVVARQLGTDDHKYTYRVLRAWLHVVRDRLTVDTAAHLGAQLPELLRGLFYEGWRPSTLPVRYDLAEFTQRYASEAGIPANEAAQTAASVTAALRDLFSPGQLDNALAPLPRPLRAVLNANGGDVVQATGHDLDSRVERLERAVDLLTKAVTELTRGLEGTPLDEPNDERVAKAARAVHQLLLARRAPG
jgi:uncharacterized protein (DUF2267 family)